MKDIKDYEGLYAITSCGKVWSYRTNKFLKPSEDGSNYLRVNLCKNGNRRQYSIHRLVAEVYIPNPDNKPQVNHKDENKQNNCINNLEWATAKENINYGTHNARMAKSNQKSIYCVELDRAFESIKAAANELGINKSHISECCSGKRKTCGGYHWRYTNELLAKEAN